MMPEANFSAALSICQGTESMSSRTRSPLIYWVWEEDVRKSCRSTFLSRTSRIWRSTGRIAAGAQGVGHCAQVRNWRGVKATRLSVTSIEGCSRVLVYSHERPESRVRMADHNTNLRVPACSLSYRWPYGAASREFARASSTLMAF